MKQRLSESGITRRALLRALGALGLSGLAAQYLGAPRPAWAQGNLASLGPEEAVEATMKRLFGGRPIKDGAAMIITFAFKATEPGALRVSFLDTHGGKYEGNADVRFS